MNPFEEDRKYDAMEDAHEAYIRSQQCMEEHPEWFDDKGNYIGEEG